MLIPDAGEEENLLNAVWHRGKFVGYWQEVLCHEVPSASSGRDGRV